MSKSVLENPAFLASRKNPAGCDKNRLFLLQVVKRRSIWTASIFLSTRSGDIPYKEKHNVESKNYNKRNIVIHSELYLYYISCKKKLYSAILRVCLGGESSDKSKTGGLAFDENSVAGRPVRIRFGAVEVVVKAAAFRAGHGRLDDKISDGG